MSDSLFYIQNKGFCGNCLLWWRVDGHGYALDLNDAWKVTKEQAESICRSRPEMDVARPADLIDAISQRHVNFESLRALIDDTRRGASTDGGRPDKPDVQEIGGVSKPEACPPNQEGV